MDNVIDFKRKPPSNDDEIYMCPCGTAMWRLYISGQVECINCTGRPENLIVSLKPEATNE